MKPKTMFLMYNKMEHTGITAIQVYNSNSLLFYSAYHKKMY